jgi:hypothetical protein
MSELPFESNNVKNDEEYFTGGIGWATYSDLGKHHVGA